MVLNDIKSWTYLTVSNEAAAKVVSKLKEVENECAGIEMKLVYRVYCIINLSSEKESNDVCN